MPPTAQILALDLATTTGWALGTVHDPAPLCGSIQIAAADASLGRLFSNWRDFLHDFLSANPEIRIVVFEAPMDPTLMHGKRRPGTARKLIGLCAVTEELLYTLGRYDVREAQVSAVRCHFIGRNYRRAMAKALTTKRCRQLGWAPQDDNAADALALWDYQRSLLVTNDLLRRSA